MAMTHLLAFILGAVTALLSVVGWLGWRAMHEIWRDERLCVPQYCPCFSPPSSLPDTVARRQLLRVAVCPASTTGATGMHDRLSATTTNGRLMTATHRTADAGHMAVYGSDGRIVCARYLAQRKRGDTTWRGRHEHAVVATTPAAAW